MPAFVESQFGLLPSYSTIGTTPGLVARFDAFVVALFYRPSLQMPAVVLAAGTLAGAVIYVRRPGWRPGLRLWTIWLTAAYASTFVQGKFFIYHFLPLLPVAAMAGALLTEGLFAARLGPARWPVRIALLALLIAAAGFRPHFDNLAQVASGRTTARDYWLSDRHLRSDYYLRDDIELADYLRKAMPVTDRAYIWGYDPAVYFLARRGTVTRFLYNFPMITAYAQRKFRAEFMRDYVSDPAEVFVVEHDDPTPGASGSEKDSYAFLQEFPELLAFIDSVYHPDTTIGRFDVLRLNSRP
jgi:hypothetical protein